MKPPLPLALLPAMLLLAGTLPGQTPAPRFRDFYDLLESVAGENPAEEEPTVLLEELQEKSEHPLNINSASREELLEIPFITEEAVTSIISFREKYGPYYSVFELSSLPGIGREMAEKISFFIMAGPAETLTRGDTLRYRGYHDLLIRGSRTFPLARGYQENGGKPPAYPGSPGRWYVRYRYDKKGRFQAGLTADKDPGEPFFSAHHKTGFDYTSGWVSFGVCKWMPRVILGDFTAGTGQGAVIWQGFSMPGSADILQASKNLTYIKPHSSSEENRFFRGAATSFHFGNHRVHLFLSSRKRDAHLETTADSLRVVTSLPASGYHRTLPERDGRHQVRETTGALLYHYARPGVKAGMTVMAARFGTPLDPGDQLYEKYFFRGKDLLNMGADYRWITGGIQLFGEAAWSHPGGMALVQGLEARLHDQLGLVISFRHFDRDYQAMWAGAQVSAGRCMNETGLYTALRLLPAPGVTLTASADWHRSPWILFHTAAPASGNLCTLRADYHPSARWVGYLRYRLKSEESKMKEPFLYRQVTTRQHNLRLQADWTPTPPLTFRARFEGLLLNAPAPEKGLLIAGDVAWKPGTLPLTASVRTAWFHTDSYASAIYTFENDLLYAFSSLTCFGHGFRHYLNLKVTLAHHLEAWMKVGLTTWPGRETTGSGNDEREGKSKEELKLQMRYRF
jgi:hypothetical protein